MSKINKTNDIKRLPTSEIRMFSKTNGIRNISKSSEISKISNTNKKVRLVCQVR